MKPAKARVLMASSVHRWNDGRIYYKEAQSLAEIADVHLIAVQAQGASAVPDGRIHVQMLPANGLRLGERKSVFLRFKRIGMVMKAVLQRKYDVFHFHDPELIPAGWLAKLRGKKVIYDMHEDASKVLLGRKWIPRPLAQPVGSLFRVFERVSLLIFDVFILASEGFLHSFKSEKCHTILNYPINVNGNIAQPIKHETDEALKLVYTGDITIARGATDMLEAVSALRAEGKNITLDLFGSIRETSLKERIGREYSEKWIEYHGWLPLNQLQKVLQNYHVGLNPIRDFPNHRNAMQTKVLDYMAAGLVVITSKLPGTNEYLNGAGCAVFFTPGDIGELQAAINSLLDEEKRLSLINNGSKVVQRRCWESQAGRLMNIYRDVLG